VKAKIALSFDGKYCVPFTNTQITSKKLQLEMHEERRRSQCIVVGSGTVVADNPKLFGGDCPIIVAIDSKGVIPATSAIMRKGTYVFTNCPPDHPHLEVVYLPIPTDDDICSLVMQFLKDHNVMECLIEGGGELQALFHSEKLIDQFIVCRSSKNIGIAGKSWDLDLENFRIAKSTVRGDTELVTVYNRNADSDSADTKEEEEFSSIADAIDAFKAGKLVAVMDSEDRENEGDLIVHADLVTEEQIALINKLCTGIICVPISKEIFQGSGLGMMVTNNTDAHGTAFTVSCDSEDCSTGVSAEDRLSTVRAIADSKNLRKPGHMFPLVAQDLGLSVRKGHTEASIDMCKLCGMKQAAVISELILENGKMMRFSAAFDTAKKLQIPIIHTDQIYKEGVKMGIYDEVAVAAASATVPIKLLAECDLDIRKYGKWKLMSFSSVFGPENKVLVYGTSETNAKPIVRIHSECFTGDVLGSEHCDCGQQLQNSLEKIYANGNGCVIFPANHEGRGIGFTEKVKAYGLLQNDPTLDTYSANTELGHRSDCRNYSECKPILDFLGIVDDFQLLTSNPDKINALKGLKFSAVNVVCGLTPKNLDYLTVKAKKHGTFKLLPDAVATEELGSKRKVCIIHASWYSDLIEPFVEKIRVGLITCAEVDIVKVPGCFEIPLQVRKRIESYDCVLCVGVILKGETYHFECMANTITDAMMKLQLEYAVPVLDYILPCYTHEQAVARLQDPQPVVDTAMYLLKN
jgi:3,4-dihydroxy 2-butanone 4-phosphate synthase/GTP cyclohydrolase II